ncbi:MAG: GAF domain-containing protein [Spirochaetales bacterium]|nr:GAF domain-containing protein [Spirochaetales bacterium]
MRTNDIKLVLSVPILVFVMAGLVTGLLIIFNSPLPAIITVLAGFTVLLIILSFLTRDIPGRKMKKHIERLTEAVSGADSNQILKVLSEMPAIREKSLHNLTDAIDDMIFRFKKTMTKTEAVIQIGRALSIEKDHYRLFHTILYYSKKLTGADAGSIYIVEHFKDTERKQLRFKYSNTYSRNLPYEEFTLPLDGSSIAGYVAVTGKPLNIADVYKLTEEDPVFFNKSFDVENGYRTKSMLVVPMHNQMNQITGVIQLINCKEREFNYSGNEAFEVRLEDNEDFEKLVVPFDYENEKIMEAVAGQAAIALENTKMVKQIKHQFEDFVAASIKAIESRDPATSGHSFRVADISLKIAHAISARKTGPFKDITFSEDQLKELEYAALLHDFGKIYIDPAIFLKGKKLYKMDYEYLMLRLSLLYRSIEYTSLNEINSVYKTSHPPDEEILEIVRNEAREKLKALKIILEMLEQLNEPTITIEDLDGAIQEIVKMKDILECKDPFGKQIELINDHEIINLKIKRGSLNQEERNIIESHVQHSYNFVKQINWPRIYQAIPDLIYNHHEKLDGSGYPDKKRGRGNIPLGARILTVADIYDALITSDRPYKKAVPLDKVIEILQEEADQNKLDKDIVDLFLQDKIYESP